MQSSNLKTKVIICDDHPIFRKGLVETINEIDNIEIIGECGDGNTVLELIQSREVIKKSK